MYPVKASDVAPVQLWATVAVGLVIALLPLWYTYAAWSWKDGHYQYFPLLLGFVGLLYWQRFAECELRRTAPSVFLVLLGLVLVITMIAAGLLLFSGFIGIIATIFAACVGTYIAIGRGGIVAMSPVLALLVLAIPLPMDLDKSLIFQMQILASRLATWLLDGAGVMHVRQGVILITEQSQFMTEEACSGVRSLFSSLAVVAVYSVATRHWWPRVFVNLIQAIMWVVLGNAIRVAATVFLADNVSDWFANGIGHELLSLLIFAFILAMVASTDQIISWFCSSQLNVDWTQQDDQQDRFSGRTGRGQSSPAKHLTNIGESSLLASFPPLSRSARLSIFSLLFIVMLLGFRVAWVQAGSGAGWIASLPRLPASTENDLPLVLGDWRRVSFEHVQRERSSLFASDSYTWHFRNGQQFAVLSADCPWAEWHNLAACYTAVGWDTSIQTLLPAPAGTTDPMLTHSEIELSKLGRRRGLVIFNAVDANGKDVRPPWRARMSDAEGLLTSLVSESAASLGLGAEKEFAIEGNALPATTIQLYSEKTGDYTGAERQSLRELFVAARGALLESPRWQSGPQ
tara:strand:- start:75256 stop:76971 length:1716 start_codon:yes stop_codon:yes gene_type:complete